MPSWPGSVWSPGNKSAGQTIDAGHVNDLQDEVVALESGYANGTARLNSSASTVTSLSVIGNSTLGSSITIGGLPYVFPSSGGSTGQVLTIVSTSGSTMGTEWRPASSPMTLLRANSGSTTNAAAENVDTVAITGLTAKDSLFVVGTLAAITQNVASPVLYNSTDGVTVNAIVANPLTAGNQTCFHGFISQGQAGATTVMSQFLSVDAGRAGNPTFTTNWTGSWTLALRHAGVTAGGTLRWSWAVYKVSGQ